MAGARTPGERDLSSWRGANTLAAELDAYWRGQGFPQVHHWVEQQKVARCQQHGTCWVVRSNLVNGLPPRVEANNGGYAIDASRFSQAASRDSIRGKETAGAGPAVSSYGV